MKRLILLGATAAAVALPATSTADSPSELTSLRGGQDLEIEFTLRSRNGEPTQVRQFKFRKFTVSCAGGDTVQVRGSVPRMKVNDAGKFDGNARNGDGGKVHIEGDVKDGGNKVVGTLKATGRFAPAKQCNTKVGWKAK